MTTNTNKLPPKTSTHEDTHKQLPLFDCNEEHASPQCSGSSLPPKPSQSSDSSSPKICSERDQPQTTIQSSHDVMWLLICFVGVTASFVCYGLLLEYATSGGRKLHELSFLFVTSVVNTLTGATGRYVRAEQRTTIPATQFAILGLTSTGSALFSVRSLRYVIYPIQIVAKSCKPVPVMLMGTLMGKSYPWRKYINVCLIVVGVGLFLGGGDKPADSGEESSSTTATAESTYQLIGIAMLFASLCFDGGTGAYEDKLMSVRSVEPFDLMYNIQLWKTILAGIGVLVLNETEVFLQMVKDMGFLLFALGLTGAIGQVFIFVTIAKFGAVTCSIIGLARKVTALAASIYFYGHHFNTVQGAGLFLSVGAIILNFWGKGGGERHAESTPMVSTPVETEESRANDVPPPSEELEKMLDEEGDEEQGGVYEMEPLATPQEEPLKG